MNVIDGTFKDSSGLHYAVFLCLDGEPGMTTQGIVEFFGIHKTRVLRAIGSLHLKARLIDKATAKALKRAGHLPRSIKDPKFWSFKQVAAIVSETPNKFAPVGVKRLQSFIAASNPCNPQDLRTESRQEALIGERKAYEQELGLRLLSDSYTSKCISLTYPGFCDHARAYSASNEESIQGDYDKWDEDAQAKLRIIRFQSMYRMISYTLRYKHEVRTEVRAYLKAEFSKSEGLMNLVRLYPKAEIDALMQSLGVEKVEGRKPWQCTYTPLPFIEHEPKMMMTGYGRRQVVRVS